MIHIRRHEENRSISKLTEKFPTSYECLERPFKQPIGYSPKAYIAAQRFIGAYR